MERERQKSNYWSHVKEYIKKNWYRIVEISERNDKAIVAISTTVIAAFTLVLAFATAFLFWSGEKVADAAKQSADVARRSLISTQRAYISFKVMDAVALLQQGKLQYWQFWPTWQNAGTTPTRRAITRTNWIALDTELPENYDFPDVQAPNEPSLKLAQAAIGPKADILGGVLYIPSETLVAVKNGKKYVYIWGWIDYDDIFEHTPRHRSEFALSVNVVGDPLAPDIHDLTFPALEKHNGADDECMKKPRPYTRPN